MTIISNINNLRRFDLNLLVVFHVLMQVRHVTRAAVLLNISQGAVSAALKRLRTLLNDPLFERVNGTMEPTPKALALAPAIARSLTVVSDNLFENSDFNPCLSHRTFHISLSDDIETTLMPWIIEKSIECKWGVQFAFHQTNSSSWSHAIENTQTDIVLCFTPPLIISSVRSYLLYTGSYLCLYDPKLIHVSSPISFEEYVSAGHIRVSHNAQRGFVDDILEAQGYERIVHASISHFAGLVSALKKAPLIATIPERAARSLATSANLMTSEPPISVQSYGISMLWDVRREADSGHVWLRGLLQEFAHEIK